MEQPLLSEKQWDMLFNKSKDFVFVCKKTGDDYTYVYINPAAFEVFKEKVIGKNFSEISSVELNDSILKYYDMAIETETQQSFQDYTVFQSEVRKYETTVIPIIDGHDQYVLAITKEVAFEGNLQDKYLFIRSIFFKTFLSTALISKDLKLIEANPSFIQAFDIDIDKMRGKSFLNLNFIEKDTKDELKKLLHEAQQGDHFKTKLVRFVDREGHIRSFTATFSPLMEEDKLVAVFMILQDVTKYLEQEKELLQTTHGLETLKQAMNSAADISVTDTTGKIVDVNDRFIERVGYTRQEIIGQTHHIVNSHYHPPEFFQDLWSTISQGKVWRGEICNRDKKGVTYWNDTTIIPMVDVNGNIVQYLGMHFNISEKKHMMTELRNIERTFRVITENTNDLIIITSKDGIISYASPSYVRLLGYEEEELHGRLYSELLDEESVQHWNAILENTGDRKLERTVELKLKSKHGECLWTEGHYKVVFSNDNEDRCEIIMLSREITERKERENKLIFMAYHDSLTNLPNRRYLIKEFPHFIEKAKSKYESIAVIYLDGDNFKEVNDVYGHDVGDEFIRCFSKVLVKCISIDDLVVRVGGDEFVLVITNLSRNEEQRLEQIEAFIQRIRNQLHEGWIIDGHFFQPTSSMGITFYPNHGEKLEKLVDLADHALNQCKSKQKNSYKICE